MIGFLATGSPAAWEHFVAAFRQGLSETGYEDRRNVWIDFRWAEGQGSRLPALAAELAGRSVSVIVPSAGLLRPAPQWRRAPVFPSFRDGRRPGQFGIVASINRPCQRDGRQLTNVLAAKRVELLRAMVPRRPIACIQSGQPERRGRQRGCAGGGARSGDDPSGASRTEGEFDAAFASPSNSASPRCSLPPILF